MSSLSPECQQLLISGYVLGNLSPAEALLFEEMLKENSDLIEEVTQMQQALDLAYNPPEIAPPVNLRDRLLATAKVQKITPITSKIPGSNLENSALTTPKSKLPGIFEAITKLAPGIALFTITLLGLNNYRLWRITKTSDVVQISQRTYLLQGESSQTAQAKLLVDDKRLNATLVVNSLPPLPPEKAYALWTVVGKDLPYTTDDKGAILTAVFQVNEQGNFTREIALPQPHLEPKIIKKIAITVEDVSAPQAHTGSIFISTQ